MSWLEFSGRFQSRSSAMARRLRRHRRAQTWKRTCSHPVRLRSCFDVRMIFISLPLMLSREGRAFFNSFSKKLLIKINQNLIFLKSLIKLKSKGFLNFFRILFQFFCTIGFWGTQCDLNKKATI